MCVQERYRKAKLKTRTWCSTQGCKEAQGDAKLRFEIRLRSTSCLSTESLKAELSFPSFLFFPVSTLGENYEDCTRKKIVCDS